jgi:hypothetical protein
MDDDYHYKAEKVIRIVSKYAGHSLEQLVLEQDDEDEVRRISGAHRNT